MGASIKAICSGDLPKAGSRTQAAKELASKQASMLYSSLFVFAVYAKMEASCPSQSDFEKIKGAMAGTSPKTFQAGPWLAS